MSQPDMEPVDVNNNSNNNGDADNNENENNENENNNNNNMNGGTRSGDEELDSANASENQEDGSTPDPRPKRKRYHRHTQPQIQEMENFFKECPHPDDKQRKELSRQLGLDHLQIKFWFQNKRTQNKNHQERHENSQLRAENNRLRADNHRYREALANALCPKCGGHTAVGEMSFEEHHLRLENAGLNEEIRQLSAAATKYTGKTVTTYPLLSHPNQAPPFEPGMAANGNIGNLSRFNIGVKEADKPLVIELAVGAMGEFMALAQVDEPLWKAGVHGTRLALNSNEYSRTFQNGLGARPVGFRTEASKETAHVFMHHLDVVHRLMDVNLWSSMFAGMVARATTHDTLYTGVQGNFDGTFHLMTAEFQVLSPLVSTRECYFVRYCKQHGDCLWAVVDISIDHLVPNLELKCRRRPSGCLIQQAPDGMSRVTWVEHVEVDDRGDFNQMYKHLLTSGQALGASRWVTTLDRQCERLAIMMATNVPSVEPGGLITVTNDAKQSMLKLAERMSRSFFGGVATSTADMWCNLSGYSGDSVRVMTRKSVNDPGRPQGLILCASYSFWLPAPPTVVFDYLRDENNRSNWDVLFVGGSPQKLTQIANGRDSRNCVSLLRSASTCPEKMVMMIQESSTDPTASFMIYAPVDVPSIEKVLSGSDSDYVPLLPSGFAIFPDNMTQPGKEGSLVNVAFQILIESAPTAMLTFSAVATVENLILSAANKIKAHFSSQAA